MSFLCQFEDCLYQSTSFKRLLRHTWDKHSLHPGFQYQCKISSCTHGFTNCQSLRRHIKSRHRWFYDTHFQGNRNEEALADNDSVYLNSDDDHNVNEEEEINQPDETDFIDILADLLLELRERYNITTDCTCVVSEKLKSILDMERKTFSKSIRESLDKK